VKTPIEPTSPVGVTTSSSACAASQYAAEAAHVFATATIGLTSRAARISAAVSTSRSVEPPGESTSSTIAVMSSSSDRLAQRRRGSC
jgi:hypothetical protein